MQRPYFPPHHHSVPTTRHVSEPINIHLKHFMSLLLYGSLSFSGHLLQSLCNALITISWYFAGSADDKLIASAFFLSIAAANAFDNTRDCRMDRSAALLRLRSATEITLLVAMSKEPISTRAFDATLYASDILSFCAWQAKTRSLECQQYHALVSVLVKTHMLLAADKALSKQLLSIVSL